MYIAKVTERFNYGDDVSFYYSEEWEGMAEWMEERYPYLEEQDDNFYIDKEGDVTIEILHAFPCDGRAD